MTTALPILFVAAHMIGDYITQTNFMAAHKLTNWRIRAEHVSIYTIGFAPVLWLAGLDAHAALLFLVMLWITHFITDSRRWASGAQWPPKPILVDQSIHLATIGVLVAAFGL